MLKFNDLSLRVKLILIILLVSIITIVSGFTYLIINDIRLLRKDLEDQVFNYTNLVGELCAVPLINNDSTSIEHILEKMKIVPGVESVILYNSHNAIFAARHFSDIRSNYKPTLSGEQVIQFNEKSLHVVNPILISGDQIGLTYIKFSKAELSKKIKYTIYSSILLLIVIFGISYILAYKLQKVISQPILDLKEATRAISLETNYKMQIQKSRQDEIGQLVDEYNNMLKQISSREKTLRQRTQELFETLENLRNTQGKLIEAEKMAAMGQLIAGVAHEVNTPLGAIQSSVGNINNSLELILQELPEFLSDLTDDQNNIFFELMQQSLESEILHTSKEERKYKQKLVQIMEDNGIDNVYAVADTLVDMHIYDQVEKYLTFLKSSVSEKILDMAYKITNLQRSANNISVAASRASKVVFALKKFSRIDPNTEPEMSDLKDGIETVLTLYSNQLKKGIEVIRRFEDIPQVECYPDELNQVWTNILHNAIQAMNYSGTIEIELKKLDQNIVVSFTDSGSGIPEDIKDKIFDPFFSTKPAGEGTGLGLDIVNRIIEKHTGKIEFDSVPGKTTFRILLPLKLLDPSGAHQVNEIQP